MARIMFIFRIHFQFQRRQHLALEGKYVLLYQSRLIGTMMMKLCVSKYVCVCVGLAQANVMLALMCAVLSVCVCVCSLAAW